jgi:peroxiredoxin Q/BCP
VSLDSAKKNAEFAAALKTQIPVLSDPDGKTAKRYGVLRFGGLYSSRWTFYIDAAGTLREIDKKVKPESAGRDIVANLARLGFAKLSSSEPERTAP